MCFQRCFCIAVLLLSLALTAAASPKDGWNFKMKDFVICTWFGADGTDAEVRVYKECGFNAVMIGRYMTAGREYCTPDEIQRQLDLAKKHGLKAFLDTYTRNHLPWGGLSVPFTGNGHHNATPAELEWIHSRFGKHPALVGYMIGDDQGSITEQTGKNTDFLRNNAPQLMPWICGWVPAEDLARHNNPIMDPQLYPTLNRSLTALQQSQSYAGSLQNLRQQCRKYDLISWPMFNIVGVKADSMIRYQVYSSIAYGAQGIWYFCYRDNTGEFAGEAGLALNSVLEGQRGASTYSGAKANLRPIYYDVQQCNKRVAAWGPKLLGCYATQIYHTGWTQPGEDVYAPGFGRLVIKMSDDLLLGILAKPGARPLAMVVDKRVSKERDAFEPREIQIVFSSDVSRIGIIEGKRNTKIKGNAINLTLPAGGGQLLELEVAE